MISPATAPPLAYGTSCFLRGAAVDAARAAAARIVRAWAAPSRAVEPQLDAVTHHDVKLALDRECDSVITGILGARFPGHSILSEESGYRAGPDPFLWIVDPLDGSVNYLHRIPFFCTSVACHLVAEAGAEGPALPDGRIVGQPLVGVVLDPMRGELFVGTAGGQALLDGSALPPPAAARLQEAVVSLSFGARDGSPDYMARLLPRFVEAGRKVRSLGSTALDIVQVAAGRIGAFIQWGTNLWDIAAAVIVAEAAGAVVEASELAPGRWRVVVSAPEIYPEVASRATP